MFAPGIAFIAFLFGTGLSLQGLTIVLGVTLGPAAVVAFSTTRTVTRVAVQALASINNSIWPELSRSVGGGRLDEARAILRRAVQLSLACSLALALGTALFGIPAIRWWTHGLVDPPVLLLPTLLLVTLANSLWYTLSAVLAATNRHQRMAAIYLLSTTAAVLGALPLSSMYGMEGAAIALLAIEIVMVGYVFPASLRVVQEAPGRFLRSLLDVRGAVRSAISILRSAL